VLVPARGAAKRGVKARDNVVLKVLRFIGEGL
jgi:hypothetical protein